MHSVTDGVLLLLVVSFLVFSLAQTISATEIRCDTSTCLDFPSSGCCGSSFQCLELGLQSQCVYKNGTITRPDDYFCRTQPTKCFYCCYGNSCNNEAACSNHLSKYQAIADGISLFFIGLFVFAIVSCIILLALRHIRLKRVRKLKQRHARLAKISLQDTSNNSKSSHEERPNDHYSLQQKRNPSINRIPQKDASEGILQPLADSH